MKQLTILTLITTLMAGCTPKAPAKLEFVDAKFHPYHYDIYFDSDTDLLNLYSDSYFQSPASTSFICSTSENLNFDIDYDVVNLGRGDVEFVGFRTTENKTVYTFKSHLDFWRTLQNAGRSRKNLSTDEVRQVLNTRARIGCKVRITVFIGPAYYSEIVYLPSQRLLSVTEQMPPVSR